MAISYDHRVIDGGNAARFTVDLVQAMQTVDKAVLAL
jgi:pyruvate/2-oxoglutarate dehydrogenase complex dihydrolipoamide acyltransferase (E2) component